MGLLDYALDIPSRDVLSSAASNPQELVGAAGQPLAVVYGRVRLSAKPATYTVVNGSLAILGVLCDGPITAIEQDFRNDVVVVNANIHHYLGTATQTPDAWMVAGRSLELPSVAYADALPGVAYIVSLTSTTDSNSFPRYDCIVRGRAVYDPRSNTTAYSDNPALCLGDFLTMFMGKTVDHDSLIAAANACDAMVGGAKLRTFGLALENSLPADQWVEVLRGYAGCFVHIDGDTAYLIPDQPAAIDMVFDTTNILEGSLSIQLRDLLDQPNIVEVTYTDTSTYPWAARAVSTPAVSPPAKSSIPLPGIQNYAQAMREATERRNKLQTNVALVTFTAFDEAMQLRIGSVISVTYPRGLSNTLFRVSAITVIEPGRWQVVGTGYDATVYDRTAYVGDASAALTPVHFALSDLVNNFSTSGNRLGWSSGASLIGSLQSVQRDVSTSVRAWYVSSASSYTISSAPFRINPSVTYEVRLSIKGGPQLLTDLVQFSVNLFDENMVQLQGAIYVMPGALVAGRGANAFPVFYNAAIGADTWLDLAGYVMGCFTTPEQIMTGLNVEHAVQMPINAAYMQIVFGASQSSGGTGVRWYANPSVIEASSSIIPGGMIGDRSLTADQIASGLYSTLNLVSNPQFEQNLAGWAKLYLDSNGNAGGQTVVLGGVMGSKCLQCAGPTQGRMSIAFPVEPGGAYVFRVRLRSDTAGQQFYAGPVYSKALTAPDSGYLDYNDAVQPNGVEWSFSGLSDGTNTWKLLERVVTIPPGVYWASIGLLNWAPALNGAIFFDDIQFVRQTTTLGIGAGEITGSLVATLPVGAGFSFGTAWTNILSVTFATSVAATVRLDSSVHGLTTYKTTYPGNGGVMMRIVRSDGVVVYGPITLVDYQTATGGDYMDDNGVALDNVPAGTTSYYLQLIWVNPTGGILAVDRGSNALLAQVLKR